MLSGSSSSVVVVVYRSGSTAVTATFFAELAELLDRLMTFTDPIVLASDNNIRLKRTTDPNVVEFVELLSSYGLVQHVEGATHDVVCRRDDLPSPPVRSPSDHRRLYCGRCQSTPHRPARRGGHLMLTCSRPTS